MTLSVVIPAYNAAETLAETLDSLLAQTRSDWCAIIVDDGSTDGTRRLAEDYAARDRRFRLLSDGRAGEGVSAARNRGIAVATDRWLLFLDADDWIDPGFVKTMLGALDAHPDARVAFCSSVRVTPDRRHGEPWLSSAVAHRPFEVFARQCLVAIHTFVLDRSLVVDLGGFDGSLRTCEDWDLWQRIARTGTAFMPVAGAFAFYRSRRHSLTSDVRPLLADSKTTIARGFSPDPRVRNPDPRYAAGADPTVAGGPQMAVALTCLWTAAYEIAEGRDGSDLVVPLPDNGDLLESCRQRILDGLSCGVRTLLGGPYPDDPGFLAAVRCLLHLVEQAANRPGLARLLEFSLEREIFCPGRPTERVVAGHSMFVRIDLHRLQPFEAPAGIDTLNIEFHAGGQFLGRTQTALYGPLSVGDLTTLAIEAMSPSVFLKQSGVMRRPGFWLQSAIGLARLPVDLRNAGPRRGPNSIFRPRSLARKVLLGAALARTGANENKASEGAFSQLLVEARAQAAAVALPSRPARTSHRTILPPARDRSAYWNAVYRTADPWSYGSPYEQLKYQRTLSLLPARPIRQAVEVACSEGRFSAMLAPRVEHLVASDVSSTALQRAKARCSALPNIEVRRLDFFDEPLPHGLDLLVCSEVLYFSADHTELARVAGRLAASLAPGGHLLAAHAYLLKDDLTRTGFDWDSPFGAKVIGEAFATTPGLALERSLQTELYRIDLWRRLRDSEAPPTPQVETVDVGPPPEADHARAIVWGGAEIRRAEAQARETSRQVPILMYHRVTTEGPESLARYRTTPAAFTAQMRWLRKHGYYPVTSHDILAHWTGGRPFKGRPVMITFDDGYRDFQELAWPILRAHDFTAEVMIVTDCVGGAATWDSEHGPPAPLMDWPQIQALAAAGVRFGSHMASHSHMEGLSSRQIALEAARSQAVLERAVGEPCFSIAAPFGESSDRFVRIARSCGYKVGLTVEPGLAGVGNDPLRLPRIEVHGGWSIDAFESALRANVSPPSAAGGRSWQ